MDWFLYDMDLRYEKVNLSPQAIFPKMVLNPLNASAAFK